MKIINFGSSNIDYVYSLQHIVAPGETETTESLEIFPGGKGLNQSIAVARAGADIVHIGCIGEDGQFLLETLAMSKVDISYIKTVEGKSGHAIIQLASDGENSIFLYPGSNHKFTKQYIDKVLADFSAEDIVILQNEINERDYIIEEAHRKQMRIVLNPSPFDETISRIDLRKISYLVLNEVEAKGFTGCNNVEESLQYFRNQYPELKIMLTLGGKGCVYMDENQRIVHPIHKVDVVDTTAAGDTFTGYFVAGILEGKAISEILDMASVAAGISVSRKGAAPSIPYKQEVLSVLEESRK